MNFTNHVLAGPRTRAQSCLRLAFYIFLVIGLLAVGYATYIIADARTYQALELRKFAVAPRIAEPHIPVIGEAIGKLEIPRVGLNAIILQGTSAKVLHRGIGHLLETPMPGEPGNIALAAHRDTFFRPLKRIRVGDLVILRSNSRTFQYQVHSTSIVSPQAVDVLLPSDQNELTLVTCFPFDYIGAAPNRFVVHATEISQSAKDAAECVSQPCLWISRLETEK